MATSLATLRGRVQVKADIASSLTFTDPQVNDVINEAYRAMWSDVLDKNPAFRVTQLPFTLTTTQYTALPSDFRAVFTVQLNPGSTTAMRYLTVQGPKTGSSRYEKTYRLEGQRLYIEPLQNCAGSYQLNYNPTCPVLTLDADVLDAELDAFGDYVVLYAADQIAGYEGNDIQASLHAAFLAWQQKLQRWASNTRQAEPDKIEDVRRRAGWGWFQP
jgi:hypothetical protein